MQARLGSREHPFFREIVERFDEVVFFVVPPAHDDLVHDFLQRADREDRLEPSVALHDDEVPAVDERLFEERAHLLEERMDLPVERGIDAMRVGEEHLRRELVLDEKMDDAPDVRAHLIGDVRVDVDALDRHAEADEEAVDDLFEDGALVLEVEIEGAARDARRVDDVLDFRRVGATREHVARHLQDFPAAASPCRARSAASRPLPGPLVLTSSGYTSIIRTARRRR